MTLLALAASITYGTNDSDACPPPFVFAGHDQCILPHDTTIGATVLIDTSEITLDCKGRKLRPAQPGIADDPATPADETVYSSPMVAFLLNGAHGVKLKNCRVDGFDFGIHARNSKRPAGPAAGRLGNKIHSNTFHTRYSGICLLDVDDAQIIDNDITATSASATPIFVWRDSDRNLVKNNRIVINAAGATVDPISACAPNPDAPRDLLDIPVGIFVATGTFGRESLTTAVIDGNVYQNASSPTGSWPEDNVIEGNSYESNRLSARYYGLSDAFRTTMKDNVATGGAEVGIVFRGDLTTVAFPGTCTLDSSRLCLGDGDCNLPSVDTTSKGSCVGITSQQVSWTSHDNVAENNDLRGPFTRSGIALELAGGSHVTGNIITGPFGTAANDAGITLRGKLPIETSRVTRNRVSGSGPALFLHQGPAGAVASFFGSTVSHNDFTGYTIAVRTNNVYNLPTELSDPLTLQGNHWGFPCPDALPPNLVQFMNGTMNPLVDDSHPYGEPVAETPDSSLPAPCGVE